MSAPATALSVLPLTAAQDGIRAGQALDPGSATFQCGEFVRIDGPVDLEHLAAATATALDEAAALHVRITAGGQVPGPPPGPPRHVDLTAERDPLAAAHAWMRVDLATVPDLAAGGLAAHALLVTGPATVLWFLRVHHVVADGYAFGLVQRRAAEVYRALRAGTPVPSPRAATLADVVADDQRYADSGAAADRAWWLGRDLPEPNLRRERRCGDQQGHSITTTSFSTVDCGGTGAPLRAEAPMPPGVREAAAALGLAWPDLLLAAVAAHTERRAPGGPAPVLGLPVAGRLGTPAATVACMAMNIVLVPLPQVATLGELARAAAAEVAASRPHHRYRYEWLRRDLRRVGGTRRLFGPVINVLPFDVALRFGPGCVATVHRLAAGPVEDVAVTAETRGGRLHLRVDVDPAVHPAAEPYRDGVLAALAELVADPDTPVVAPVVLDGGPLPRPARDVVDLITERAAATPDAPAVVAGATELTYAALVAAARERATALRAAGAGPGRLVAMCLPRGADAIVTILAALVAGAGYVPLDPDAPQTRRELVLADTGPAVLVDEHGTTALPARETETGLGYVVHTSGSTGRPHGVAVDRAALAHFVAGATTRYGITAADRVLQFAPLHFDAHVEELFVTLCAGATVVVRTPGMVESVPALLSGCAAAGITVLDLPTALWHELAHTLAEGAILPPSVRLVIIGGEAALPDRVARWHAAVGPEVTLLNTYGPTEATVVATAATLRPGGGVPIGRPLPGVRAIVDRGELLLAGGGLARGYLHDPDRTAQRFPAFGAERVHRTGDRVRVRPDGQLEHAGRVDDQVKIDGHRADPLEVEAVLAGHPGVREVAVVVRERADRPRLVAHVVPGPGGPGPAELRAHAGAALPAALVPAAFVVATALPRTPSGKIDRRALRTVDVPTGTAKTCENPVVAAVAAVFADVLGVPVGPDDDLFELGGQSMAAIRIAGRVGAALDREVRAATVFRNPTARGLAAAVTMPGSAGEDATLPAAVLADTVLPPDVRPAARPPRRHGRVLLAGSATFTGAALLAELAATGDEVVCLLEPGVPSPAGATVVRGELAGDAWHVAAGPVDAVYHAAAPQSPLRDYPSLRRQAVEGTLALLLHAAAGGAAVHHISTLAIAPPGRAVEEITGPHPGLRDGYRRARWVIEQLLSAAAARGLSVTVHRAGRVLGTAAGTPNEEDVLWHVLRAGLAVGALPPWPDGEVWTAADGLARAVVAIAAGPDVPGVRVHHHAGRPVTIAAVDAALAAAAHPVRRVDAVTWRDLLTALGDVDPATARAVAAALAHLDVHPDPGLPTGPVDTARADAALTALGLPAAAAGPDLLAHLLRGAGAWS